MQQCKQRYEDMKARCRYNERIFDAEFIQADSTKVQFVCFVILWGFNILLLSKYRSDGSAVIFLGMYISKIRLLYYRESRTY